MINGLDDFFEACSDFVVGGEKETGMGVVFFLPSVRDLKGLGDMAETLTVFFMDGALLGLKVGEEVGFSLEVGLGEGEETTIALDVFFKDSDLVVVEVVGVAKGEAGKEEVGVRGRKAVLAATLYQR